MFIASAKRRSVGKSEAKPKNPEITHKPNQTGMIATCAVAASPIISRRPTSSPVASAPAIPTAKEIKNPVSKEFDSESWTDRLLSNAMVNTRNDKKQQSNRQCENRLAKQVPLPSTEAKADPQDQRQ